MSDADVNVIIGIFAVIGFDILVLAIIGFVMFGFYMLFIDKNIEKHNDEVSKRMDEVTEKFKKGEITEAEYTAEMAFHRSELFWA